MKPLERCRLYTFVDMAYLHGRKAVEVARQLCSGGADVIQLRAKEAEKEVVRKMGADLLAVTSGAGVWLVINDYPDVALEIGAPASHLGQEDFFDAGFTRVSALKDTPGSLRIGLSTHSPEQAHRALASGPDYVAIGPVFATATKPTAKPVTLDYVRWAAAHVHIPWFAIGGITLDNLDEVLAAGARRICVVSAILNAKDIAVACAKFKERLTSVPLQQ